MRDHKDGEGLKLIVAASDGGVSVSGIHTGGKNFRQLYSGCSAKKWSIIKNTISGKLNTQWRGTDTPSR